MRPLQRKSVRRSTSPSPNIGKLAASCGVEPPFDLMETTDDFLPPRRPSPSAACCSASSVSPPRDPRSLANAATLREASRLRRMVNAEDERQRRCRRPEVAEQTLHQTWACLVVFRAAAGLQENSGCPFSRPQASLSLTAFSGGVARRNHGLLQKAGV